MKNNTETAKDLNVTWDRDGNWSLTLDDVVILAGPGDVVEGQFLRPSKADHRLAVELVERGLAAVPIGSSAARRVVKAK